MDLSFRIVSNFYESYLSNLLLLGAELFTRPYLFFEPIGRAAELIDLDIGLGPHDPELLEAEMNEEDMLQLEAVMADGAGGPMEAGMAADFLMVAGFQLAPLDPGHQEEEIHDFVYEDDLDVEDGAVVMQA
uniref:Uncharacterized protein n=1 Tax=Daucus carota subsp. sativus TaxID=79200 RepID=A0A161WSL8_DAUCS